MTDDELILLLCAVRDRRCTTKYAVNIILAGEADWHPNPVCPCQRCEEYRDITGQVTLGHGEGHRHVQAAR